VFRFCSGSTTSETAILTGALGFGKKAVKNREDDMKRSFSFLAGLIVISFLLVFTVGAAPSPRETLSREALNASAWALAGLDERVPVDIRRNLTFLREDLLDEAKSALQSGVLSYKLGSDLCNALIGALDERNEASVRAGYRAAQANAATKVTSADLEVRRNYLMSWPQYAREQSQRAEIARQQNNQTALARQVVLGEWASRAASLRRNLDELYKRYREALRQDPNFQMSGGIVSAKNLDRKLRVPPPRHKRVESLVGFQSLFNGRDLTGWTGDTKGYGVADGKIICSNFGGNLYTEKVYSDFIVRFEFKLTPGANNGLAIHTSATGDSAYEGMEIQILDDTAEKYAQLKPWQFHGSIYGVVAAKGGHLKPVGEWNVEEVSAIGPSVKVVLNGVCILDANLEKIKKAMDGRSHPGRHNKSGHIGFLGYESLVEFRNIYIKELSQ